MNWLTEKGKKTINDCAAVLGTIVIFVVLSIFVLKPMMIDTHSIEQVDAVAFNDSDVSLTISTGYFRGLGGGGGTYEIKCSRLLRACTIEHLYDWSWN